MSDTRELEFLTSCDDRKLIELLRSGTEDAIAVLISRYIGLVRFKASAYTIRGLEKDDIVQEGLIGLLNAIENYDVSLDYNFSTYANTCIENRLRKAVEYANTDKSKSLNRSLSIDELDSGADWDDSAATPEEIVIAREKLDAVRAGVDTLLSDLERDVLFLYLDGEDYKQISQKIGISAKAVDNALQRVRRKLKKFQK